MENLDKLESKVIVDRARREGYYGRPEAYQAKLDGTPVTAKTIQQIAEAHKISPIAISLPTAKDYTFNGYNKGVEFIISETETQADDYRAIVDSLSVPVVTDKQNSKYCYYGAGAEVLGVYRNKDVLTSFHPINDARKGANRIAAEFFLSGQLPDGYFSNLKIEYSGGHTFTYGKPMYSLISFKRFNNGSGAALCKKEIEFSVPKRLSSEINIDSFGEEYLKSLGNNRAEILSSLRAEIESAVAVQSGELASGDVISFRGVPILKNDRFFPVTLVSAPTVRYGSHSYNDEIRSIVVEAKGYTPANKKNVKLRGTGKKLTTLAKPFTVYKIEDAGLTGDLTTELMAKSLSANRFNDADIVLNGETIKSSIALLELYANAHLDREVVWKQGKLFVDGNFVSEAELEQWFDRKRESFE